MAIAGQRFEALSKDFDVSLTSISESDPRKIINSASNSVSGITDSVLDSISKIKGLLNVNNLISKVRKAKNSLEAAVGLTKALSTIRKVQDAIREGRGGIKSIFDTSKFSSKDLDRYIANIFAGDTIAQNLFKGLTNNYRDTALADISLGKPYDKIITAPEPPPGSAQTFLRGSQEYDYNDINQLINRVSSDSYQYEVTTIDNNMMLKKVTMVANVGYAAGMPGVMKAMASTPGLTDQVRDRAIALVMSNQANKGNVGAILDMADPVSGVLNDNNSPLAYMPSLITDLMTNFQIPLGTKEKDYEVLGDAFLDSMENLDPNWNKSTDNLISLKYAENISQDMTKVLEKGVLKNTFEESDLDVVFDSDEDVLVAAMIGFDVNTLAELENMSKNNQCKTTNCNC